VYRKEVPGRTPGRLFGDFGLKETAMAAAFGFDFFSLKNEPNRGRLGWQTQHFLQVVQGYLDYA
jgi:hypothetical protein